MSNKNNEKHVMDMSLEDLKALEDMADRALDGADELVGSLEYFLEKLRDSVSFARLLAMYRLANKLEITARELHVGLRNMRQGGEGE